MAWTTPKTWVNQDPLNESNFNTFIRDNQAALREQTEDAEGKLAKHHPAYLSPLLVGYAVIFPVGTVRISGTSFQTWHAKCKLTFTPKTDMVLFGVQYQISSVRHNTLSDGTIISLGLQKDGSLYGAAFTDTTATTSQLNEGILYEISVPGGWDENDKVMIQYQVPVVVTRAVETTIAPMIRMQGTSGSLDLKDGTPMILTALDVGAYE